MRFGALVVTVIALLAWAFAQSEPRAIIDKSIAAQGGQEKTAQRQAMSIKARGKMQLPMVGETPFTIEDIWQIPGKYRSTLRLTVNQMDMTQILVLNGDHGWFSMNGQTVAMSGPFLTEAKDQVHAEMLDTLLPLREGHELSAVAPVKINGRDAVGLLAKTKGFREVRLYFDKESGFLLKREHKIMEPTGVEVLQEVYFSDYKDFEGLKHWSKIAAHRNGRKMLEAEVTEVKFFDKVSENVFSQP